MSSLFKSKKEEIPGPREITTPLQKEAQERLRGFGELGQPVTPSKDIFGDLPAFAPDLPEEAVIPGLLKGFTERQTPGVTTAGIKQIMDTLTGGFDPATSPFYQSLRKGIGKEKEIADIRLKQIAQEAGQFRSTGRFGQEADLEKETFESLAGIMAALTEGERQKKLDVLPQAFAAGAEEEQFPLRSLAALQQFSLFPRRQAELETKRQDILRGRGEQLNIAQLLADPSSFQYYQPQFSTEASPFERFILPIIASGAKAAGTAALASSIKLKEDVKPMRNSLAIVNELQGVTFKWKKDGIKDGGVIAEDVEKIIPNAVIEIDGVKHIKPMVIIGYLLEAVKEISTAKN